MVGAGSRKGRSLEVQAGLFCLESEGGDPVAVEKKPKIVQVGDQGDGPIEGRRAAEHQQNEAEKNVQADDEDHGMLADVYPIAWPDVPLGSIRLQASPSVRQAGLACLYSGGYFLIAAWQASL
jgi:hypothetical protein